MRATKTIYFLISLFYLDDVACGVALTSMTFMGFEGDRFATVCLQLFNLAPRDASAQLVTVDGVGTATGMMGEK